ncbi:hypothetical protein EUA93_06505 [Nocardioides oleivorans]|uniref:Uncharacterized protein n=1 Tax=Nocardioides oleivorans TaxID=273676 RepID=A0A4Q2S1U3_9ACTN|nr:hypothetical protein [Nocardioides oleivorans]RYB94033.1 hypothetical protein EUA93_06505 [Nocardioides oleivorans]
MSDTTPGAGPTPDPTEPTEPTPGSGEPAASTPPPYTPPAGQPAGQSAGQPGTPPAAQPTSGPDYGAQASQAAATLKAGNPLDLGIIGAGLVAFIASLFPYYTVSVEGFGGGSANAWHGFFGWFGALVALVGAGLLAAKVLGVLPALPVPVRTAVLGCFALATLCTLLALFVTPGGGCDDAGLGLCDAIDQGHGIGYWLALLAVIAGTALSFVRRSAD